MNQILDVLIVGAGAIGLACGIEAKKANLNYLIIDKGCLVNAIFHYPANMTFFSTSDKLEIGGVPFISHGDKPTRREALDYYRRVAGSWELKVKLYEKVGHIQKKDQIFEIQTEKGTYFSKNIVLATGFYDIPNLMNVKGEDLPKVKHYYTEPHLYAFQKIVVVGAANSAVDVALECYRRNAEVTMVIKDDRIWDNVKYWVKPDIENRIKEGSIKAYFHSEITEIRETEVDIQTPNGKIILPNDFVLAMTGYQPNFTFLEMLGVNMSQDSKKTPVYDPQTQESNQKGIYLGGVVCGGMETGKWFIENSRQHSVNIVRHIVEK
ncbi:MAG: YpdA family putative bacillithiol disulfide reductase [Bacteroidetes bacterium]|nr:MAG: YpdA family putative bacillithiol disulfide reductase [Bacteroidota bacterium]